MKRRTPVLGVVLATVIATFTAGVAQAVPATPGIGTPDTSTTGHVQGTVTSDQPFVFVGLDSTFAGTALPVVSGSVDFDLETWGYTGTQTVHAVACPSDTYVPADCSTEATADFTPTDVVPDVTWFTDDTVGPGQAATVTVTDTGGGTLQAVWANDTTPQTTALNQSGDTDLSLVDGTGTVTIQRCSTVDPLVCTGFTPAITHTLTVRTTASAALGAVADITGGNPDTTGTVTTDRAGTYTVTWHLEQSSTPVAGTDGSDSGTLDGSGAAVITIPGTGLADGSYDIKGTITVTDPSFGEFPAAAFSGTVTVDSTPLFSNVVSSVPGQVTGTVSSLAPYVYVWFGTGTPSLVTLASSSDFDLPTWGYAGSQTLHAVACPTTTQDNTCTAEQTTPFTPTDSAPTVTWSGTSDFAVKNVNATDPTPALTVSDPNGGGTLVAVWDNAPTPTITPLNVSGLDTTLDLPDGTGTLTVERCSADGTVCTGFTPPISTTLSVDTTAPVLTSITSSHSTLYPLASTRPGSTVLTVVGSGMADVTDIQLSGPSVIDLTPNGSGQVTWYGRPTGASTGALAPAGSYTVTAYDAFGNASSVHATVVLSAKTLVLKTYRRTVTARGSLFSSYVGRCSTLRKPSLRGWVGSFGFYSDTRCHPARELPSLVSTEHIMALPAAERYLDVHVDTYGGAARSVPTSQAIVRYLRPRGTRKPIWVSQKLLTRRLTTHAGATVSLSGMLWAGNTFLWGVATDYGNRYDVKTFTVVARYYVLG